MSVASNPGDGFHRLLHLCFVQMKAHALHLKVGNQPRVWFGSRNPKPVGFKSIELKTREIERESLEDFLNLVPTDSPALEVLQATGSAGFFLADYPAIVYAEKRDGELELFIHREPEPRSQRNDEEE